MKQIDLPDELRRLEHLIGFTIPRKGCFHIADHDEVVLVDLSGKAGLQTVEVHPYDFVENNADFLGLVFDGLPKNEPILHMGKTSISCTPNPAEDFVVVAYTVGPESGEIRFELVSQGWFEASLSDDGQYLVLAEPSNIQVYQL